MDRLRLSVNPLKAGFLLLFFLATTSFAQNDPLALQQQAIKRIDAYLDFVRKTGDFKSRIPDLVQADSELTESNRIFETRKDWTALALGLTKQGSIFRLQSQYPKAITLYKKAEEVAKLAQNRVRQAEALSFIALTELNTMNYGPALVDAKEAVRIAEITGDMKLLENSLGNLGSAQIRVREFDGAAETVNREIEAAKKAKDPMALFMAYNNRSSVYLGIAEQCDNKPVYEACYQALDLVIPLCQYK